MSLDVHIQSTKSLSAQTVMLQLIWGWLISVVTQPWLADWHTTRKLIQAKLSRCFFLWTRSCQNISFYTFAFFIQISKCHTPWTVNITPPPLALPRYPATQNILERDIFQHTHTPRPIFFCSFVMHRSFHYRFVIFYISQTQMESRFGMEFAQFAVQLGGHEGEDTSWQKGT